MFKTKVLKYDFAFAKEHSEADGPTLFEGYEITKICQDKGDIHLCGNEGCTC